MSVRTTTLDNGLRVVTAEMSHVQTAALGVWVRAGARNERPEEHGLSHLLEHMAFKGTRRRNARQIAEEIESVGGDLNAATSHETTAYYARVLKEDVPLGFDILSDILRDSVFDGEELRREQHVILQEIGAALDDPDDLVHDLLQAAAFGDQPIGRPILGTAETVAAQRVEGLRSYLSEHYRAPEMIVGAAGAVDHEAIVDLAGDLFGGFAATPGAPSPAARYVGGERKVEKDLSEANLLFAFPAPAFVDEDFYAARIAAAVLGGGMSSRLFQRVREEKGLCYSIYAFNWAFSDVGLFGISAATEPQDIEQLIDVTTAEVSNAISEIDDQEVTRARAQLKAGLLMGLESCAARVEQIARQSLFLGRTVSMEELTRRIDAVDAASVRNILARIIYDNPPTLAAVGPVERLESASDLQERLRAAARDAA
ncbi:pitrilysin family protein [Microbaculum marinum]|uniref:Pitrilysin family protein n=1 Tax=Microbaculum marinum TaxID=1764581 RepID=A0AAW9RW03_9HYPH